jgi:hypothetical protein
MVVDDAATTLAHRGRTGKRRVHFINLLVPMPLSDTAVGRLSLALPLRGYRRACNLLPNLEALGHLLTVLGGGQPVTPWAEVLGDGTMRGKKTLGMCR